MATEINVWTGAEWESIRGPAGATGPEGPTVVSADTVNVAKLGTDGKILVAQADLDARYVNMTGDTMTGVLSVKPAVGPATPDGSIAVVGDGTNANFTIQRNADANGHPSIRFKRSRGTTAAPTSIQGTDSLGAIGWNAVGAGGTYLQAGSIIVACTATPVAGDTLIRSQMAFTVSNGVANTQVLRITPEAMVLQSNLGILWTTPTNALEVQGSTMLRTTLEVVGNITSAGAAHSFAAGSIPSSAVIGSTAFTPATSAAAGAVGSMRWDENFLYVRTATAWKRIALASF